MELLDYRDALREIIKSYNKNPNNWRALMGRSPRGFYDFLFLNPKEVWYLKIDTIYKPNPIGLGVKLDVASDYDVPRDLPSYGFRNIPKELLKEIDANPQVILKVVREIPPVSVDKIRGLVAIGPYIQKPVLKPISKKQEELSIKMDRELEKLLKRNYPFYI